MSEGTAAALWWCSVMMALAGCSTQPRVNVINAGDPVAIMSAADAGGAQSFDIHNRAVGQGAKTGAEAGAVTGAAYGLVCGPLFIICSPLGAAVGAVAGAGTGAVIGSTQGVGADQDAQATAAVARYLQQHDPQEALVASVVHRAGSRWRIEPRPAERELVVHLDAIGLHKKIDGPVLLVLKVTVGCYYPDRDGRRKTVTRTFEYEGPQTYIDSWIGDDEEFLMQRFTDAYQTMADNIVVAFSKS